MAQYSHNPNIKRKMVQNLTIQQLIYLTKKFKFNTKGGAKKSQFEFKI